MRTIKQFCQAHHIAAKAFLAESNPNMDDMPSASRHWSVILRRPGHQMTILFSTGPAIESEPNAEDLMNCLGMDAAGYENAQGFEDWASEYGYDTDSRKAEKAYRAVKSQTTKLAKFLPVDAYNELLWDTESL